MLIYSSFRYLHYYLPPTWAIIKCWTHTFTTITGAFCLREELKMKSLLSSVGILHREKTPCRNIHKKFWEITARVEQQVGTFLFLFLTLGAKCGYRQESHKIFLFLAACFPNDKNLMTMKTWASNTSAEGSRLLMQKQQQSQNSLHSPQDDKTHCISMH